MYVIYGVCSFFLITADGHENRISDTEELLGSAFCEKESLDRSRVSCSTPLVDSQTLDGDNSFTLPPSQSHIPQPTSTPKQQLNLEVRNNSTNVEIGMVLFIFYRNFRVTCPWRVVSIRRVKKGKSFRLRYTISMDMVK